MPKETPAKTDKDWMYRAYVTHWKQYDKVLFRAYAATLTGLLGVLTRYIERSGPQVMLTFAFHRGRGPKRVRETKMHYSTSKAAMMQINVWIELLEEMPQLYEKDFWFGSKYVARDAWPFLAENAKPKTQEQ